MNKLFSTILSLIIITAPNVASGASLEFMPKSLSIPQSEPFTVTILLDTEGESINAVDGFLSVPKEFGDNITVTDSGSIVTFWVTSPDWDPSSRAIKFSGTIPGGYSGKSGILFSLVFPSYSGGELDPALSLSQLNAYLNDGLGTKVELKITAFKLGEGSSALDPEIAGQLYIDEKKKDEIPPETFSPQVSRDDRVFDGKWFINFATTDKQSGVDHYEIQESRSGSIDSGKWKIVQSPYVLEDQDLHSYIFVLAVDRQGNERIIQVYPRDPLSWWESNYIIPLVSGLVIVGLIIVLTILKRKRKISDDI